MLALLFLLREINLSLSQRPLLTLCGVSKHFSSEERDISTLPVKLTCSMRSKNGDHVIHTVAILLHIEAHPANGMWSDSKQTLPYGRLFAIARLSLTTMNRPGCTCWVSRPLGWRPNLVSAPLYSDFRAGICGHERRGSASPEKLVCVVLLERRVFGLCFATR